MTDKVHSRVARLLINRCPQSFNATGFIVKLRDRLFILTCAHTLYDIADGVTKSVKIFLGQNKPFERNNENIIIPKEHKEGQNGFDFGLIPLTAEDIHRDKLHHFTFVDPCVQNLTLPNVFLSGYAGNGDEGILKTVKLTKVPTGYKVINYDVATCAGYIGSPIYIENNSQLQAIGIHSEKVSKGNGTYVATVITKQVVSYLEKLSSCSDSSDGHVMTVDPSEKEQEPNETERNVDLSDRSSAEKVPTPLSTDVEVSPSKTMTVKKDITSATSGVPSSLVPLVLPSILPFSPKVMQMPGSFEGMLEFIPKDQFNILPPFPSGEYQLFDLLIQAIPRSTPSGLLMVTSSLHTLMHISSSSNQPSDILFEIFGAIPGLPLFVLCVLNEEMDIKEHTTKLAQDIVYTCRKFTDEKIMTLHGPVLLSDFKTKDTFKNVLRLLKETSGKFCIENAVFVNTKKCRDISRSSLVAMAVTGPIPFECKDIEVRLGSKEDLREHFHAMTTQLKTRIELEKSDLEDRDKKSFKSPYTWGKRHNGKSTGQMS